VKSAPGEWDALSLPISSGEMLSLRRDLLTSAAVSFRPDILLVDHMPHGARGELLPALEALRSSPTTFVLGLRDILDAPDIVQRTWSSEGAAAAVEEFYDLVLVYGDQRVFDVADQYAWGPAAAQLVEYCGYVCAPVVGRNARRIRTRALLAGPQGALVVAMAGGGADAFPMMDALLEGFEQLSAESACSLILITGPFMPAAERRQLTTRAHGLPVQVRKSVRDTASYIAAADVVVGMAGYNTTVEILRSGKPAVLVPRDGPSAEQRMRAGLFADHGWVRVVDPIELSPDRLAATVLDALRDPTVAAFGPDLAGLDIAVGHLLSMVDDGLAASPAALGL
jgi:predicted glycosyltransferase